MVKKKEAGSSSMWVRIWCAGTDQWFAKNTSALKWRLIIGGREQGVGSKGVSGHRKAKARERLKCEDQAQ